MTEQHLNISLRW